jgi:hypothetical protein
LIKGIEFEEGGPRLISSIIKDSMNGMDTSVRTSRAHPVRTQRPDLMFHPTLET